MSKPRWDRAIPDLMTLVDAAARLGMSRVGLHKAAREGRILGREISPGVWVFRRAVIEQVRAERVGRDDENPRAGYK